MITLTRKQQIIMRHLAGESNRQIASALHISKDTVNKYVKEYDAQRAELLAKDPGADPSEVLHAFVEQPKYNTQNRMPVKVTPEMRAAVAECLRLNEEKRASGRRKQEMRKTDIDDALNLRRQISVYLPPTDIFQPLRQLSQESFEILITEDALLHLPDQLLHEDDSLLCVLDRIFDDATVFNIRGESYRGKKLETIALQTGKASVLACTEQPAR